MGLAGMTVVLSIPILLLSIIGHTHGFGPAYGGDEFLRLKEIPPAVVAARSSGSVTLACSVTGSPTPTVAWYRGGKRLAGTTASPGGLGETWARLHLACLSEGDAGEYECKGEACLHYHTIECGSPRSTHGLPTEGQEWRPANYHWMALNSDGELRRNSTS